MKIVDVRKKFYEKGENFEGEYTIIHLPLAFLIFIILLITTLSLVKPIQYVTRVIESTGADIFISLKPRGIPQKNGFYVGYLCSFSQYTIFPIHGAAEHSR